MKRIGNEIGDRFSKQKAKISKDETCGGELLDPKSHQPTLAKYQWCCHRLVILIICLHIQSPSSIPPCVSCFCSPCMFRLLISLPSITEPVPNFVSDPFHVLLTYAQNPFP